MFVADARTRAWQTATFVRSSGGASCCKHVCQQLARMLLSTIIPAEVFCSRASSSRSRSPSRSPWDTWLTCVYCAQALLSLVTVLLVGQCAAQAAQAVTDADVYNFALNLEYLEVRLGPGVRCSVLFPPDQHCATALGQLVSPWLILSVHILWRVLGHQAENSPESVRYSSPPLVL